ncbi:MAG: NrdH-redoxin [Anaerolineae bacterium]|nr:NrdH-redoxin [Anaerolineae bacterium]
MTYFNKNDEILLYSAKWCPDCHRTKFFFDEYGISYKEIDVDEDEAGLALVKKVNQGYRMVPTVIFPDGTIFVEPPNSAVANKLGLVLER